MALPVFRQSVPDVARRLGLSVGGRPPKIRCLFHDEKVPSMVLYEDHYHCFGCGAHGGAADLVMAALGCGIGEALRWLYGSLHVAEKSNSYRRSIQLRSERLRKWVAATERAALVCLYSLLDLARLAEASGDLDLAMAAYADAWLWEDPDNGVLARMDAMDPEDVEREFSGRARWLSVQCDAARRAVCLPLALRLMAEREAGMIREELREQEQELRVFLRISGKDLSGFDQIVKRAGRWRWRRQMAGR